MPVNPVKPLVKAPIPVPSIVLLLAMVGAAEVLQHIPRTVMLPPPSLVIFPPDAAVVWVMVVIAVVVIVARIGLVLKLISDP